MCDTISRFLKSMFTWGLAALLAGCVSQTAPQPLSATIPRPASTRTLPPRIANPASENCIRRGGTLIIRKRGDGGEYGVCVFEDNRQCEEWAMFRGKCLVGGIKITGYTSPAARFCAITGGAYRITDGGNTDREQGTCTFSNGRTCDAWDYYNGKCRPDTDLSRGVR